MQKDNRIYFSPIHIKFNADVIENGLDSLLNVDGKPYVADDFEKEVLKELDF